MKFLRKGKNKIERGGVLILKISYDFDVFGQISWHRDPL